MNSRVQRARVPVLSLDGTCIFARHTTHPSSSRCPQSRARIPARKHRPSRLDRPETHARRRPASVCSRRCTKAPSYNRYKSIHHTLKWNVHVYIKWNPQHKKTPRRRHPLFFSFCLRLQPSERGARWGASGASLIRNLTEMPRALLVALASQLNLCRFLVSSAPC